MFENINIEFWLGQIFTLVATVVGVYLAANSGFDKAIEFENLQHQRETYHVQASLLKELTGNQSAIESWLEEFEKDPMHNNMDMHPDKYQLDMFLWQTTQEGSAIFEVPYNYVSGLSDFYGQAEFLRGQMLSGNPFEAPKAAKELGQLISDSRAQLVADFSAYITRNKEKLVQAGLLAQ